MTKSMRSTMEDRIEAGIDAMETKVIFASAAKESGVRKAGTRLGATIKEVKIALADLDKATPEPEDPRQQKIPGADPEDPSGDVD